MNRADRWELLRRKEFDVAVVGGGINGACLYYHLCASGYRTVLIDRGDFACGTSQASAMMIWGGLLYMSTLDFRTVFRLCEAREEMIRDWHSQVQPSEFRYLTTRGGGRNLSLVHAALHLYWLFSRGRRRLARRESAYPEQRIFKPGHFSDSLIYEEARVLSSDSNFVLHWILPYQNEDQAAMNYCSLKQGAFDQGSRLWKLEVEDVLDRKECTISARLVANAAGVWSDRLNQKFQIESPYYHVLSKGVFLSFPRLPGHETPLIIDTGRNGECMSLIPWGPVSYWGPTENTIDDPDHGARVTKAEVRTLMEKLSEHLTDAVSADDIVSMRSGIRPLAAPRSYVPGGDHTLEISRRHRIHSDSSRPWISIYGGKLTNCIPLAQTIVREVKNSLGAAQKKASEPLPLEPPPMESFPGLVDPVPSAAWCAEHRMACTLEDYLRRRTNISQWSPRGGLGRFGENLAHLSSLSVHFRGSLESYIDTIRNSFDPLVETWKEAS